MNHVERFRAVINFESVDRLPRWEWAMWWDETIERWHHEGLPCDLKFNDVFSISQYFGLDPYMQFWFSTTEATIEATQHHTEGLVANMDDYLKVKPRLYPDHSQAVESMRSWAEKQKKGQAVVWTTLEGFFWFPRTLMDIERLSYAFYDQPELVHAINRDLLDFNVRLVQQMASVCVPTFMTFAEDMSYNHGPMISQKIFHEFIAPYYRKLIPLLEELNIIPIIDTDGDVTAMVPWVQEVGIVGVLPLERQAGVDGATMRESFPDLRMIGHFDKMVMDKGADAIREEFERLLPALRTRGFVPSVDHQTPPQVSLEQYRCYLRLLEEYSVLAAG
jgi:uroporphyrinogen-III decarboxylase